MDDRRDFNALSIAIAGLIIAGAISIFQIKQLQERVCKLQNELAKK